MLPTRLRYPSALGLFPLLLLSGCARAPEPPLYSSPTPQRTPLAPAPPRTAQSPLFVDVAEQSGLRYRWEIPGKRPCNILQTIGNGCAFLDYDRDGNLDILLIGPHPALYRGDGHGQFTDVTSKAGLGKISGHFLGCAVGDYDNDGFPDLYLSAYRGGVLLHNESRVESREARVIRRAAANRKSKIQNRKFVDVTVAAGLATQPWGASCAFADLDGDGRIDLYIANYVRFGPETTPQFCDNHGVLSSCGPNQYAAEKGVLYRNLGQGRFRDVTAAWGYDRVSGKTLGVAAAPFEGAGPPVLALANDQTPGDLMAWRGTRSENLGKSAAMAYGADGHVYGGMGIDWGDYDNDRRLDLVIATYQNQAKCVFRNQGGAFLAQDTAQLGMLSSVPWVAFGTKWLDFDNDGWLDLLFVNGHVQDNIAEVDVFNGPGGGGVYRQPAILYHNRGGRRFEDASARLSGGAQRRIVGRGLAIGDYDGDGRLDALVVDSEGGPLLLHNRTPGAGRWLLVDLVGRKSNRDGYGAVVTVDAGGRTLARHCHADGSYLSASDKRVHFGLGNATKIDRLQVRWPDGMVDTYRGLSLNRTLTLYQGEPSRREDAVRR